MCIVVDINTLAPVFSETCDKHAEFRPVKEWIDGGRGVLVFGGTEYKRELARTFRYMRLVRQMKDAGKAVAIRDDVVDAIEIDVRTKTRGQRCDDQHIIALLGASRCPLFCSDDLRSYNYVKQRSLYPAGMPKVRIYSSSKNSRMLKLMSPSILKNLA
jgi:hypothetical protein